MLLNGIDADADVPVWYTAVVPLPLALPDVLARVKNGYYRHVQALEQDAHNIASNAALFNGPASEIAILAEGAPCTLKFIIEPMHVV